MSIETALTAYLKIQSTVTDIIGNGDSPVTIRFYPLLLPQNPTLPACRYQVVTAEMVRHIVGPTARAAARIQIDSYADTYTAVKSLAAALRTALDGYVGAMGSLSRVFCRHVLEFDGYDVEPEGIYRITSDYWFSY